MIPQSWRHWGSPRDFYQLTTKLQPWLFGIAVVLLVIGIYGSFFSAPPDYQQGEAVRIIFVHVPAAWMSLFIYVFMAITAGCGLVFRAKLAPALVHAAAPIGASFTFITLVTGSLWGKPMWGTWWTWDARLTSELILLFLYLGYMGLHSAIEDRRIADKAGALLLIIGVVNIPIIHFSVEWWNTLHQPASITKLSAPSVHSSILWPLLTMALACKFLFAGLLVLRCRGEIIERSEKTNWLRDLIQLKSS